MACVAAASVSMWHSCASGLIKNSSANLTAHRKVCEGFPGTCKCLIYPATDSFWSCLPDFVIVLVPLALFGVGPSGADNEPLRFRWAMVGGRG